MNIKSIIIVILLVVATVLATQNTHPVNIKIIFWELTTPLIVLVFFIVALGFVLGYFSKGVLKVFTKGKIENTDIK